MGKGRYIRSAWGPGMYLSSSSQPAAARTARPVKVHLGLGGDTRTHGTHGRMGSEGALMTTLVGRLGAVASPMGRVRVRAQCGHHIWAAMTTDGRVCCIELCEEMRGGGEVLTCLL